MHTQSPFLVVPYLPDSDGRIEAQLPTQCPLWQPGDAPCSLARKGYRARKTILGFSLCLFRCRQHNKKFTAYPPGYAPFLRKPLVSLAPNGDHFTRDTPTTPLDNSAFRATLDAARGKAWPKYIRHASEQCFMTQMRHLRRIASLLGIACHQGPREHERSVAYLGVNLTTVHEAHRSLVRDTGYKNLGRATWNVLYEVASGCRAYERLLESGYLDGLWGRPHLYTRFLSFDLVGQLRPSQNRAGPGIVNRPPKAS